MKAAGCFVLDRAEDLNLWRSRLCRSRCLPWPATRGLVSLTPGLWQRNTKIHKYTNTWPTRQSLNYNLMLALAKQMHKKLDLLCCLKKAQRRYKLNSEPVTQQQKMESLLFWRRWSRWQRWIRLTAKSWNSSGYMTSKLFSIFKCFEV